MQRIIELFKRKEPKPFWYSNPWGLSGGLFGSATIVLALGLAYKAGWLSEAPYVIFLSVMIFLWGFLHSKAIELSNNMWEDRVNMMALMDAQHGLIKAAQVKMEIEDEIISQQKKKIALLEIKIEALEVSL